MTVTDTAPGEEPSRGQAAPEAPRDLGRTSIGPLNVRADPAEVPAPMPGLAVLRERLKRMEEARQAHAARARLEPPQPPVPDPGE